MAGVLPALASGAVLATSQALLYSPMTACVLPAEHVFAVAADGSSNASATTIPASPVPSRREPSTHEDAHCCPAVFARLSLRSAPLRSDREDHLDIRSMRPALRRAPRTGWASVSRTEPLFAEHATSPARLSRRGRGADALIRPDMDRRRSQPPRGLESVTPPWQVSTDSGGQPVPSSSSRRCREVKSGGLQRAAGRPKGTGRFSPGFRTKDRSQRQACTRGRASPPILPCWKVIPFYSHAEPLIKDREPGGPLLCGANRAEVPRLAPLFRREPVG